MSYQKCMKSIRRALNMQWYSLSGGALQEDNCEPRESATKDGNQMSAGPWLTTGYTEIDPTTYKAAKVEAVDTDIHIYAQIGRRKGLQT